MLNKHWEKCLEMAGKISNFNARAMLTIFYFTIFLIPSFVLIFLQRKVEKRINKQAGSYFHNDRLDSKNIKEMKKQW